MQDDNTQKIDARNPERMDAVARLLRVLTAVAIEKKIRLTDSYQRLVDASEKLHGIYGGMALTKALHYSDAQLVNNWQRRGVSRDGALDAERYLGIPATYIIDGTLPPCQEWQRLKAVTNAAEQPVATYESNELRELNELGRAMDNESLRALLMLMKKL